MYSLEFEFIASDGNGRKTGVRLNGLEEQEAKAIFENAKHFQEDIKTAPFLLDIRDANGGIVDTIAVSKICFSQITGFEPESEAYYREFDKAYWGCVMKVARGETS